jgi:hypothetical protein
MLLSFEPLQLFFKLLVTQLRGQFKHKMTDFISTNWRSPTIIGIHHRHGNGETDDFMELDPNGPILAKDGKRYRKGGRGNSKTDEEVVLWMQTTVEELARANGIAEYRVMLASDAAVLGEIWKKSDPTVLIFDAEVKAFAEGKGFAMTGWQGPGRSPGSDQNETDARMLTEPASAFMEMALLGFTDMLIVTKKTSFSFMPAAMVIARNKIFCHAQSSNSHLGYFCFANGTKTDGLAKRRLLESEVQQAAEVGEQECDWPSNELLAKLSRRPMR